MHPIFNLPVTTNAKIPRYYNSDISYYKVNLICKPKTIQFEELLILKLIQKFKMKVECQQSKFYKL